MDKKLKIGIAGYGVVGTRRRHHIDRHPQLKTIAVCDRKFDQGGMLEGGVRYHQSYQALLEEDLDALFVCMSNDMAAVVTIASLKRGLHVFCEKPPARNLEEFSQVLRCACQFPKLKLKYGFNHRYHDSVRDALRIVREGELGRVLNMNGVYGKSKMVDFHTDWRCQRAAAGGGILLDQGIHMVDLMRLFVGEFSEITSVVSNSFWNHDVEDNAHALMRTKDGVTAFLHSSATQWRHRFNLDIGFEKGAVTLAGILSGTKSYGAETITVAYADGDSGGDPREIQTRYNHDHSWQDEIAEFADVVLHDRPVLDGSAIDAMKTLHLVYRIYCADPVWRNRFGLSDKLPEV